MLLEKRIAAVGRFPVWLCDLDGTLVDTMPLHHKAYAAVLAEWGGDLSFDAFRALAGGPAQSTIPRYLDAAALTASRKPTWTEVHRRKKEAFALILDQCVIEALPLTNLIKSSNCDARIAVVTSGNRHGAAAILKALNLTDRVELIVSGDDVSVGKPDPEPYLIAARKMGVAPGECLVFEDHPDGIASARAAGMTVIDVTTMGQTIDV